MRRAAIGLALLAAAAGCVSVTRRPTVPEIVAHLTPPLPPDGLLVDSVLAERPLGDPLLDRDVWADALPVGSPETRALLAENGLRVGVLSGAGPQAFQALLASEADAVGAERRTFRERKDDVIPTARPADPCRFAVRTDLAGQPVPVELSQARGGLLVRPEAGPDGRVRVWCEPRVQHGERQGWLRPNADATGFARRDEVPAETYPGLGFEAVLGPDDTLLLGRAADQPDTLGAVLFTASADGRPRQRVLVVRARSAAPAAPDLPAITGPARPPVNARAAGGR
ncbi:MAG: hypothetical protein C0501_15990 [Isosphaera sp.]|nr:hypothetical protein [Isosphaera sp.]